MINTTELSKPVFMSAMTKKYRDPQFTAPNNIPQKITFLLSTPLIFSLEMIRTRIPMKNATEKRVAEKIMMMELFRYSCWANFTTESTMPLPMKSRKGR